MVLQKRKWPVIILTATLLAGLLMGCSKDGSVQKEEEKSQAYIEENSGEESTDAVETEAVEKVMPYALMEEQTLVDNENITVTVKAYDPSGDLGPTFTLLLENKTESNLYFTLSEVSVNDVMNDPMWGENVAPSTSISSELYWFPQDLAAVGINYIEEIEGTLWVYDAEDYSAEDVYEDTVLWTVTNSETSTPAVEEVEFAGGIDEIELFTTDRVSAVLKDFSIQGDWGPTLNIYLENHTESTVLFYMTSVYVNDIEIDPYWNEDVRAGKTAYSSCYWWQEELENRQIEEIKTLSFTFAAKQYESWDDLAEVTMTISLEGSGEVLERREENP